MTTAHTGPKGLYSLMLRDTQVTSAKSGQYDLVWENAVPRFIIIIEFGVELAADEADNQSL